MLEENLEKLFVLFRANYYHRIIEKVGTGKGDLSAAESFCVEILYLLEQPTVTAFAQCLGISVPNAAYKVSSLIEKGYLTRVPSKEDKREAYLAVTRKYLDDYGVKNRDNAQLIAQVREAFAPEEVEELDRLLKKVVAIAGNPFKEKKIEK